MSLPEGTHLVYMDNRRNQGHRREVIEVMLRPIGGGTWATSEWKFGVEEYDLFGTNPICVEVFDDAFAAFTQIPEFFTSLATENITTLDALEALLLRLGAADETPWQPGKD